MSSRSKCRLATTALLAAFVNAAYFSSFDLPINDGTATPTSADVGFAFDADYKWIVSWGVFFGFCAAMRMTSAARKASEAAEAGESSILEWFAHGSCEVSV